MMKKKTIFSLFIVVFGLYLNAGIIDEIKQKHKIRIGIKYNTKPFGFKDGRRIKGFDMDLSKLIIDKIKERLNISKLKVYYKKVIPANREQKIINRDVDMIIATYTINKKRKEKIDFSIPYFQDRVIIVSKVKRPSGEVGVLKNSSTKSIIEKMGFKSVELLNYFKMFGAFDNGDLQAISTNESILSDYIKRGIYYIIKSDKVENYGIGLPKGDVKFKKLIDSIIEEIKSDGTLQKIYDKWFVKSPDDG